MSKARRLSDQIRKAIDASGLSRYRICKAIGLDQGAMSKFMSRERGLELATIDRLGELLGLRVVLQGKRKGA